MHLCFIQHKTIGGCSEKVIRKKIQTKKIDNSKIFYCLYLFEFSKIHFFSEIKVFVSNLLAGIIDCNAFSVVP